MELAVVVPVGRQIKGMKAQHSLLNANHRRQRTPRVRPACILRQFRGAAAERWAKELR
jgi:hypothetical protein